MRESDMTPRTRRIVRVTEAALPLLPVSLYVWAFVRIATGLWEAVHH